MQMRLLNMNLCRHAQCLVGQKQVYHKLPFSSFRNFSSRNPRLKSSTKQQPKQSGPSKDEKNLQLAIYALSGVVAFVGLSYAAVPLYRAFCQATGYGGTTQTAEMEKFKRMKPVEGARPITIYFNADTDDTMPWQFKPQQHAVRVVPGETALAFFRAYNPTNKAITGVSTYNVTPMKSGVYFNKIQCFCFEEQRLRPHEEIDMPVFFYIDPEFVDDPSMRDVVDVTLSYTFFRTGKQSATAGYERDEKEESEKEVATDDINQSPKKSPDSMRVQKWAEEISKETGAQIKK